MPRDERSRAIAHEVRTAVSVVSARLQLTARHIERGEVDPVRLLQELRELDRHARRLCAVAETIERRERSLQPADD